MGPLEKQFVRVFAGVSLGFAVGLAVILIAQFKNEKQKPRECRPYPGYCDIDTDNAEWRGHR